jgi:hypothetical protein
MDRTYTAFVNDLGARQIADALEQRQYTHPHQLVRDALEEIRESVGFGDDIASEALERMGVNTEAQIGRLRHTELLQLARSIARFWRESVPMAIA